MVDTYVAWDGSLVPLVGTSGGGGGGGGGTGGTKLFPGDPGAGFIMWGQTRQGGVGAMPARAKDYQTILGAPKPVYPKAFRIYIQAFSSISAGKTQADQAISDAAKAIAFGAMPCVTSKELTGQTLAQLAAGSMDQYIDYLLEGLIALNKPMVVDYHQEPIGQDRFGSLPADPVGYAGVIGRFAARRDLAGGTNLISLSGCLGIGAGDLNTGGNVDPAKCLPWLQQLAPVCDLWGSHHYIQVQPTAPDSTWKKQATMAHLVGDFWDVQDSVDDTKARFHGEWGVHTKANDLTFAPKFMDQFLTYAIGRNLRVINFFDSGLNSPNGSWELDTPIIPANTPDTTRLVAMAHELVDPRVKGPSPV